MSLVIRMPYLLYKHFLKPTGADMASLTLDPSGEAGPKFCAVAEDDQTTPMPESVNQCHVATYL